jgi:hypothetical protein
MVVDKVNLVREAEVPVNNPNCRPPSYNSNRRAYSSSSTSSTSSSMSNSSDSTGVLSVPSSSSQAYPSAFFERRSVKFGKIQIREYDVVVGDNPACSSGAPISLGWGYNKVQEQFPVEVYENFRSGQRCHPEDLKLNERVRYRRLLEWNISTSKIARAERRCRLAQEQRKQTILSIINAEEVEKWFPRQVNNIKENLQRIFSSILKSKKV